MKSIQNPVNIKFGYPISKLLYEWVTKVDLNKWNILVNNPISVRNFITQYTDYMRDIIQFNQPEYWQDPSIILDSRNDDCEGINNLAVNILYSLGYDCRLSLGRYDTNNNQIPEQERYMNHAYGLLYLPESNENPYIIDCTGDDLLQSLPLIDNHPEYYTWWTGSGILKCNFICNHLVGYIK